MAMIENGISESVDNPPARSRLRWVSRLARAANNVAARLGALPVVRRGSTSPVSKAEAAPARASTVAPRDAAAARAPSVAEPVDVPKPILSAEQTQRWVDQYMADQAARFDSAYQTMGKGVVSATASWQERQVRADSSKLSRGAAVHPKRLNIAGVEQDQARPALPAEAKAEIDKALRQQAIDKPLPPTPADFDQSAAWRQSLSPSLKRTSIESTYSVLSIGEASIPTQTSLRGGGYVPQPSANRAGSPRGLRRVGSDASISSVGSEVSIRSVSSLSSRSSVSTDFSINSEDSTSPRVSRASSVSSAPSLGEAEEFYEGPTSEVAVAQSMSMVRPAVSTVDARSPRNAGSRQQIGSTGEAKTEQKPYAREPRHPDRAEVYARSDSRGREGRS